MFIDGDILEMELYAYINGDIIERDGCDIERQRDREMEGHRDRTNEERVRQRWRERGGTLRDLR